jgi:hypothetical protein
MQQVSWRNSYRISENYRSNILTVATGNDDIIIARGYCGWLLCYR